MMFNDMVRELNNRTFIDRQCIIVALLWILSRRESVSTGCWWRRFKSPCRWWRTSLVSLSATSTTPSTTRLAAHRFVGSTACFIYTTFAAIQNLRRSSRVQQTFQQSKRSKDEAIEMLVHCGRRDGAFLKVIHQVRVSGGRKSPWSSWSIFATDTLNFEAYTVGLYAHLIATIFATVTAHSAALFLI